jgi:hypothetical protein
VTGLILLETRMVARQTWRKLLRWAHTWNPMKQKFLFKKSSCSKRKFRA